MVVNQYPTKLAFFQCIAAHQPNFARTVVPSVGPFDIPLGRMCHNAVLERCEALANDAYRNTTLWSDASRKTGHSVDVLPSALSTDVKRSPFNAFVTFMPSHQLQILAAASEDVEAQVNDVPLALSYTEKVSLFCF